MSKNSISLKFNSGDPALLYRGEGLEPIRTFGLHTDHELDTVRQRAIKAESERDAALDREMTLQARLADIEEACRTSFGPQDALNRIMDILEKP